jgi:hypothetical protein
MRFPQQIIFVSIFFLFGLPTNMAWAVNAVQDSFMKNLAAVGIGYTQTIDKIDITIDENKTVNAIPSLEHAGVIPTIADVDLKRSPFGMAITVVGVSFTAIILDSLYLKDPKLDKIHVQAYVIPHASHEKQLCYSFEYDRGLYKKIDLNTLTPKNFMMNTPYFAFSDWCRAHMKKIPS